MDKKEVEFVECPYCEKTYKTKTRLNIHLQRIHSFIKEDAKKYCNSLNVITFSEMESSKNIKKTCLSRYGTTNGGCSKEALVKIKQTNLERYGVEYTWQDNDTKEKIKRTNLERYGTENPMQNTEIFKKREDTCKEKYGFKQHLKSPIIQKKIEKTNTEKYNVKRPCQADECKQKQKESNFKKYGRWYTQTDEHDKYNYRWKDYIYPSGKIIRCQGYEPLALNVLLNSYVEREIITSTIEIREKVGDFWYDFDNKKSRYYPDIFIPKENLIIEVKSIYTYSQQKKKNIKKKESCINKGFKFEFWVFNPKDELVDIIF